MKTAIIAIGKNEELYLDEWITYHLNLGFDGIIFLDNNDLNNNSQKEICKKYEKVVYKNKQSIKTLFNYNSGQATLQMQCYNEAFNEFRNVFDWFLFIDIDEFLTLENHKNVNDFLMSFDSSINQIILNWKCYGDNNLVYYEPKPVMERFTKPYTNNTKYSQNFPENEVTKCFIKSSADLIQHRVHFALLANDNTVDALGNKCSPDWRHRPIIHQNAYLKHYETKTIDEYIRRRILNKNCLNTQSPATAYKRLEWFFNANEHTPEKDNIYNFIKSKL